MVINTFDFTHKVEVGLPQAKQEFRIIMKFLWKNSNVSIEEKKYIDSQEPFLPQREIKLHQDHINGQSTMPRDNTFIIPP